MYSTYGEFIISNRVCLELIIWTIVLLYIDVINQYMDKGDRLHVYSYSHLFGLCILETWKYFWKNHGI